MQEAVQHGGSEENGEDLRNSCFMEPVPVIVQNVEVRYARRIVHAGGIIKDMEADQCLSCARISVLDAFSSRWPRG